MFVPPRPAIAFDRVMHVGYPIAVVVADALDQARDAAERIVVEYESRPGVVSARDTFAPDAPQLYDGCPNNEAYLLHPAFGEALKVGKKDSDERVERSLYQRAVGSRMALLALLRCVKRCQFGFFLGQQAKQCLAPRVV
jgi:CO/xanthine dehydrogenase Mo-binding subunit